VLSVKERKIEHFEISWPKRCDIRITLDIPLGHKECSYYNLKLLETNTSVVISVG
jgi:hypothetical protein